MSVEPWAEVYRAKDGIQAHMFADELIDAGIEARVDGDMLSDTLGGFLGWSTAPRIWVPKAKAGAARALLSKLESEASEADDPTELDQPDE